MTDPVSPTPKSASVSPAIKSAAGRPTLSERPSKPLRILVLSGPNLQLLGRREPGIYGTETLDSIHGTLQAWAREHGTELDCRQSNHEGTLVDWIGAAPAEGFDGIVMNPAAYTHTSVALHDAIKAAALPTVEIHLSNPEAREPFRHHSFTAPACIGKVAGFGPQSYWLGLVGLVAHLDARR